MRDGEQRAGGKGGKREGGGRKSEGEMEKDGEGRREEGQEGGREGKREAVDYVLWVLSIRLSWGKL